MSLFASITVSNEQLKVHDDYESKEKTESKCSSQW